MGKITEILLETMQQNLLKLIFAIVYLVVDLTYVFISKGFYTNVAVRIQGSSFPPSRFMGAMLAYIALVVGWWFFAANLANIFSQRLSPFVAGAIAGALYGFVVYGVFNGTLYVMFDEYKTNVVLRDLLWGIVSASTITAFYAFASKTMKK